MPAYDPRGGGNVHQDVVLSNISVARFRESGNVASALFPEVRVNKQSDKYNVFGRESWRPTLDGDVRGPATEANEIPGMRLSTDTYFTSEHALQGTVTPEERENADSPLSPDRDQTENVTQKIILNRELACRNLVYNPATYIPSHVFTLGAGAHFDDYTNSNPFEIFREAQRVFHKTMSTVPNLWIIPWDVMWHLSDHPKLRDRLASDERSMLTEEDIASLLGLQRVMIPGQLYNQSRNPGTPEDIAYMWSQHIVAAWVPPRPGRRTPAFGYEFVWPLGGRTQITDRWYEQARVADVIRVRRRYDFKVVAKDDDVDNDSPGTQSIAGMLIENAISDTAAAA